jgi:hypothetical protein
MLALEMWHRNFMERGVNAKAPQPPAILATEMGRSNAMATPLTQAVTPGAGLN